MMRLLCKGKGPQYMRDMTMQLARLPVQCTPSEKDTSQRPTTLALDQPGNPYAHRLHPRSPTLYRLQRPHNSLLHTLQCHP